MTESDAPRRLPGYSYKVAAIREAAQADRAAMPLPVTRADVEAVLAQHPKLHNWGHGSSGLKTTEEFTVARGKLLTDDSLAAIQRMRTWIMGASGWVIRW